MSLNKAIKHGKEKREPYRKPKLHDRSCRNHGGCPYCEDNRRFSDRKRRKAAGLDLAEYQENSMSIEDFEKTEEQCQERIEQPTRGTLKLTEPHPMAYNAMGWMMGFGPSKLMELREAFATCAIEGNRAAEVCGETLGRLLDGRPVSDRYLLGLAWMLLEMINAEDGK